MVLPMGNDMLLWDEFHPALYKLKAEVTNGKKTEIKEIQFGIDRKSTRLNSSHSRASRMPSSA